MLFTQLLVVSISCTKSYIALCTTIAYTYKPLLPPFAHKFNCHVLVTECQIRGIDLIFVLDESGSVGSSNFQNIKTFTANLVRELEIGPGNTRVGVITFSSFARVPFHLNTYQTNGTLLGAIASILYSGGGTNTPAALNTLLNEFSVMYGARPSEEGIPRIAIVVTDGMSNRGGGPPATIAAANTIHANNILAYAVGVGDSLDMDELNAIASDPSSRYVRLLSDFDINELRELQESLNSEACQGNILNLHSLHSCNTHSCCQMQGNHRACKHLQ